jgi:hypothetical protein
MLNYGREQDGAEVTNFIQKYTKIFGSAFDAWQETIPFDEYTKIIATAPYYICPCRHQSGLGAIGLSIAMGKTIFLSGDNLSWIRSIGVKVYDIASITDYSFESLFALRLTDKEKEENFRVYSEFYDRKCCAENWFRLVDESLGII